MTKSQHILATRRALAAEDLSFTTYTLMILLAADPSRPMSVNRLSIESGMSYHAARNQLRRMPWFATSGGIGTNARVSLSPDGTEKLARIEKRIK